MMLLHGHRFELYTLVSEIHVIMGTLMGIKNVYEIEVVISTRDSCLCFISRSIPFFPKMDLTLEPREQRFLRNDMPFLD